MPFAAFLACVLILPEQIPPPKKVVETLPPPLAVGLKLPESPLKAQAGKLTIIRAETSCKVANWILPPGVEADINEGGLKLTLVAPVGRYVLYCVTAPGIDKSEIAKLEVEVTGSGPVPGPVTPPGPGPAPPADPFTAELQKLYGEDQSPTKAAAAKSLASLYQAASTMAANDGNTTVGEFMDAVAKVAKSKLPDPAVLKSLRARLAVELTNVMPSDPDLDMDPATRAAVAKAFTRIATVLEALK